MTAKNKNQYTPFQQKVFQALAHIPFGQTRSYQWLAQQAGYPGAARAVALALKKNQNLFILPCHRVIKSDGTLGGYVLGKKIKKMLLDLEKQLTPQQ